MLAADGGGRLRQAQRQVAQLVRDCDRAGLIGQPGSFLQVTQRLAPAEPRYVDRVTEFGECLVSAGDDDLGAARGGQERPQFLGVGGVVENQQAFAGTGLQVLAQSPC